MSFKLLALLWLLRIIITRYARSQSTLFQLAFHLGVSLDLCSILSFVCFTKSFAFKNLFNCLALNIERCVFVLASFIFFAFCFCGWKVVVVGWSVLNLTLIGSEPLQFNVWFNCHAFLMHCFNLHKSFRLMNEHQLSGSNMEYISVGSPREMCSVIVFVGIFSHRTQMHIVRVYVCVVTEVTSCNDWILCFAVSFLARRYTPVLSIDCMPLFSHAHHRANRIGHMEMHLSHGPHCELLYLLKDDGNSTFHRW